MKNRVKYLSGICLLLFLIVIMQTDNKTLMNNWVVSFDKMEWQKGVRCLTISISVVCLALWLHNQHKIRNISIPRKAGHELLFPDQFFEDIFIADDGSVDTSLIELRNGIVAEYKINSSDNTLKTIAECVKDLHCKYKYYIDKYLNSIPYPNNRQEEYRKIQKQIGLLRKIVAEEKESFLAGNDIESVSFILNRQNHGTDLFLTSIAIPLILEILQNKVNSINDFNRILQSNDITYVLFYVFICVLCYRVQKYARNKYSMLTANAYVIKYNKLDLLISIFENALDDVAISNLYLQ